MGILLRNFVFKHVQRVHRHGSRFIAVDLFFTARKIKLVNIYNYQTTDFKSKGKSFSDFVIQHLKDARLAGFKVIIMGDFNLDPFSYHHYLDTGRSIPKHFSLIDYLHQSDYTDLYLIDSNGLEYATHYDPGGVKPISRIDLIWHLPEFLADECLFTQVWCPPSSLYTRSCSGQSLDHRCVVVFFSQLLFLGFLPLHHVKQKGLWRQIIDTSSAIAVQWSAYQNYITSHLPANHACAFVAIDSPLPSSVVLLNSTWNTFKSTILSASAACLPVKRISQEAFSKSVQSSDSLLLVKSQLRTVNKVFAFLTQLLYTPVVKSPEQGFLRLDMR